MLRVAVIDGQGGGIGTLIVRRLKESFGERIDVTALGTNAAATAAMMKAGANRGATGENAIVRNSDQVDIVTGPVSSILAHGLLGEVTPRAAEAVASCRAEKIILPIHQERMTLVGIRRDPLPHLVDELIDILKEKIHV